MRVRSLMRPVREAQGLSLRDVAALVGLAVGELSMIERGHMLPHDTAVPALEKVYGGREGWHPAGVQRVLYPDIRCCPGCWEELPADASRRRVYHDSRCQRAARKGLAR